MIEIIIALLLNLGINLDKESINVIDERTGLVFGVGNNSTGGTNSEIEPSTYILCQDEDGKYYLIPK